VSKQLKITAYDRLVVTGNWLNEILDG